MTHLDGVAVPAGQRAQERGQGAQLGRGERAGKLDPERVHTRVQRLHDVQERGHVRLGAPEAAFVGDRLRQLDHEPEAGIGLGRPGLHRRP